MSVSAVSKSVSGKDSSMKKTLAKRQRGTTSKKPTRAIFRPSTFSLPDYPASRSPLQTDLELEGFPERMRSFFSMYYASSSIADQNSYSLKTLKDCFPIQKAEALRHGYFTWKRWGTMRNGRILTGRPLGCSVVTNTSFLLDGIVKNSIPKKNYLSGKTIQYMLSRLMRRHDRSFNVLQRRRGQGLTIARLSLTSMASEQLYQPK